MNILMNIQILESSVLFVLFSVDIILFDELTPVKVGKSLNVFFLLQCLRTSRAERLNMLKLL